MKTILRQRWEPYDLEDARDVSPLFAYLIQYAAAPETWVAVPYDVVTTDLELDRAQVFGEIKRLHYDWYIQAWNMENDAIPTPDDNYVHYRIAEDRYQLIVFEATIREALPAELREMIHKKFNYTCVYCGAPSEEVDHVTPVSRGGSDDEDNLVASCQSCNRRKSDRLLPELGWRMAFANGT